MNNLSVKITEPGKHLNQMQNVNERYDSKQKSKIAQAALQFEALFTSMLLRSMNSATEEIFDNSENEFGVKNNSNLFGLPDGFDAIFEQQFADFMTRGKSIGIADAVYKKVTGEELPKNIKTSSFKRTVDVDTRKYDTEFKSVKPASDSLNRLRKYEDIIDKASNEFGVDKNLIRSVILAESAANHNAISPAKAKGLMQLIDSTATEMGVKNSFDPEQNIFGGTKYLAKMLRQYNGNLKLALAAYNAGPNNVEKYNGIPPFKETQRYIEKVISYLNHFNENES
ncbi:transglycosylase SLT domain-containing protein [Melioribacter sp. OK-6-Me]|uniref:transglycosylase SLT domain-containing protein n=1 Tax=unclassified Melioribacter TaxID=2627329 RepID=UPI003EDA7278